MTEKKIFIKTYGCQMNVYDSIKMQDLMAPQGYSLTDNLEDSDIVILNTCHIREKAAEKVYSELGRIRQVKDRLRIQGKRMFIVVAGCVGQAEGEEIFSRAPYVDIVVGPQSYHSLPKLVMEIENGKKHLIDLDFVDEEKFDKLPEDTHDQGASAFVSIQEGCDKFCTFCVVPYTRGAEFSRPVERVYREVLHAVSHGSREVTFLGQNVNAYHGKTSEDIEMDLAGLIERVSDIKGLERIRYMTSHPRDMNDALIKLHGSNSKLMPFLHLPLQSGSNKILKSMNRRHSREEYFDIIERLRALRPDLVMSSDFIVGFPGETDEDFADTIDAVKRVGYGQCYSFAYSPRPGTPASTKDQIPDNIKNERLHILQEELFRQQLESNQIVVGKVLPVLFDREGKKDGQILGKTPYMQSVHIQNPHKDILGKIVDVRITAAHPSSLSGELL